MDINIEVKPEQIEKAITEAVVKSALGEKINESVRKALGDYELGRSIDGVIRDVINAQVRGAILSTETLKDAVTKQVQEKMTDAFVEAAVSKIVSNLFDSARY